MTKKAEVLKRVSGEIEDQARTTMFLMLAEAKEAFKKAAMNIGSKSEDELTTIIDYFRGKIEKETVWEECEKFRAEFVDKTVEEWRQKRR